MIKDEMTIPNIHPLNMNIDSPARWAQTTVLNGAITLINGQKYMGLPEVISPLQVELFHHLYHWIRGPLTLWKSLNLKIEKEHE